MQKGFVATPDPLFKKASLKEVEKKLCMFLRSRGWFHQHIAALWGVNQARVSEACSEYAHWEASEGQMKEVIDALYDAPDSHFKSMALSALLDAWPGVVRT